MREHFSLSSKACLQGKLKSVLNYARGTGQLPNPQNGEASTVNMVCYSYI